MSSASDDLIEKIRQERLGERQKNASPYARLIVFPALRRQLLLLMVIAFGVLCYLISRHIPKAESWWSLALPITGIGMLLSLFPLTEMWEYGPWQTRTRRYERHQTEK